MLTDLVRPSTFAALAAIALLGACGNDVDSAPERVPGIDQAMLGDVVMKSEDDAQARVSSIRSGGVTREDIVNEIDAAMLQTTRRIDAATAGVSR